MHLFLASKLRFEYFRNWNSFVYVFMNLIHSNVNVIHSPKIVIVADSAYRNAFQYINQHMHTRIHKPSYLCVIRSRRPSSTIQYGLTYGRYAVHVLVINIRSYTFNALQRISRIFIYFIVCCVFLVLVAYCTAFVLL